MYLGHSKKLEWALSDFITSNDGTYYDDEIESGSISCYFRLDNEICVEQKVHIRKYDYICYTTMSWYVNPEDKDNVSRYVQMANAINLEIDYGHFEVNFRTGDILFKSCYEPDDKICSRGLFKLLVHPRRMINKFGHFFNVRRETNWHLNHSVIPEKETLFDRIMSLFQLNSLTRAKLSKLS